MIADAKVRTSIRYRAKKAEVYEYIKGWKERNRARVLGYSREWMRAHVPYYRECTARRRAGLICATPSWLSAGQIAEMRAIYAETPAGYHVDHIVPLRGKNVCGLHVPWNLQILLASENMRKSAKFEC